MKHEPTEEFQYVKPFWTDAPQPALQRGHLVLRGFILGCGFIGLVLIVIGWLTGK